MMQPSDSPSVRGWVLYDGHCGFCSRWVTFWAPTLERHGFATAALEEPWVGEKLRIPYEELVRDIRLLMADGTPISGANVYLQVTRRIWWAWPFYALFSLPGLNGLMHLGYRWFAQNRHYVSHACGMRARPRGSTEG
jgi:predicted DCC family thiol-disulfide oxidoreductase YuxK